MKKKENKIKKSQLKKIIRESIKGLITEQGFPGGQLPIPTNTQWHGWRALGPPNWGSYSCNWVTGFPALAAGGTYTEHTCGYGDACYPFPIQYGQSTGGSEAGYHQATVDFYINAGSPLPGQIVKITNGYFPQFQPACIEYLGLINYDAPDFLNPWQPGYPQGWQTGCSNGPGGPQYGTCTFGAIYNNCADCHQSSNPIINGCTDPTATNYNPNATNDDGSCNYDVYGCLGASGGNGICVGGPYAGQSYTNGAINHDCTTGNTNYPCNDGVTIDDGSCIPVTYGCLDQNAINYYSGACMDDPNSCVYIGCADPNATNHSANNIGCSMQGPTDTSCCNYPPPLHPCEDLIDWENHAVTNYPQLNGDPIWRTHFCEYCIDGTIPPGTDSYCKCCPGEPDIPVDIDPTLIEKFQKLANIKK